MKSRALAKGALKVIDEASYLHDKQQVILDHELTLASRLRALGFSTGVAFTCPQADSASKNPTVHFWRPLVDAGFPFVKVSLVTAGFVAIDDPELAKVLGAEWTELLKDHLRRRRPSDGYRAADTNLPAQPAISIEARFGDNGALQAYNPTWAQALPVVVPLDDLDDTGPKDPLGPAVLAAIHCFYLDEAERILANLARLPLNLRALLTTDTQDKAARIEAFLVRFGLRGEVVVAPNRGRNLAPFLVEIPRRLRREGIVLHLHTKKSPHDVGLADWARFVRRNLVGSPEIVRSILHLLEQQEIGVVYSEHFGPVEGLRNWGFDFLHARRLMRRLGVTSSADFLLDFPTGSMFRSKRLIPVRPGPQNVVVGGVGL